MILSVCVVTEQNQSWVPLEGKSKVTRLSPYNHLKNIGDVGEAIIFSWSFLLFLISSHRLGGDHEARSLEGRPLRNKEAALE